MQVFNGIVGFVAVAMMNFVTFGDFPIIILPNGAVKALRFLIIQRL